MIDTLSCMDCLELMETIPDGAVSMILTDPPYGISYQNQFTQHPIPYWRAIPVLIMCGLPEKATASSATMPTPIFLPGLTAIRIIMRVWNRRDSG